MDLFPLALGLGLDHVSLKHHHLAFGHEVLSRTFLAKSQHFLRYQNMLILYWRSSLNCLMIVE